MTTFQIDRIKYHLRYPLAAYGLDPTHAVWPALIPIDYDLEGVIARMTESEQSIVVELLDRCNKLDEAIFKLACLVKASKVGDIETDPEVIEKTEKLYDYYVQRLVESIDHRQAFGQRKGSISGCRR